MRGSETATVVAALAIFLQYGRDYGHAVLKATNMFGSGTDTIGAMVGALTRIALWEADTNDPVVDHRPEVMEGRDTDMVSLARNRSIHEGQRVTHPVFALGWVLNVNSQQIRRRDGGTMLLPRVAFHTGQTPYSGHI